MRRLHNNKKNQMWQIDFIASLIIVSLSIILIIEYTENLQLFQADPEIETHTLSQQLLDTGIPQNWTEQNVIQPGLKTNNKLDEDKITQFYNLDPTLGQIMLGISAKYHVVMYEDEDILVFGTREYGGFEPTNPAKATTITRHATLKSRIIRIEVTTW